MEGSPSVWPRGGSLSPLRGCGGAPRFPAPRGRRLAARMLPPQPQLSPLCLSPSRLGGTAPSPEWLVREHGQTPVPGVQPCPAAVSDLLPRPRGSCARGPLRVTQELPSRGHPLMALSLPLSSRWLLLGAVTVGLLAQSVLAVSPGSRSWALIRARESGRDTLWPCQKAARVCSPERACVCARVCACSTDPAEALRALAFPRERLKCAFPWVPHFNPV